MAKRRVNPNIVKLNWTYDTRELAACCGVHKNTVTNWHKAGLEPIDNRRPIVFHGSIVREFLKARNASRKHPCGPGKLFCFRCREPKSPALKLVEYAPLSATTGNLRAFCVTCEAVMHRKVRRADIAAVMRGLDVQFAERPPRLIGSRSTSLNCGSERQAAG
jgi:hypothetical protein